MNGANTSRLHISTKVDDQNAEVFVENTRQALKCTLRNQRARDRVIGVLTLGQDNFEDNRHTVDSCPWSSPHLAFSSLTTSQRAFLLVDRIHDSTCRPCRLHGAATRVFRLIVASDIPTATTIFESSLLFRITLLELLSGGNRRC